MKGVGKTKYSVMSEKYFNIRNYRPEDFENYVQLHAAAEGVDGWGGSISKRRLAEALGHPAFQPQKDLFIAESSDNIIGYVAVFLEKGIRRAILDGKTHPQHRKKGIATELFRHAVRHAAEANSRVVQVSFSEFNLPARNLASRLGLEFIRRFFELQLNLNRIRLADAAPDGYMIRHLEPDEADRLTDIQNRAFAESWGFNPNTPAEVAYRINSSCCSAEDIMVACLKNKFIGYCWPRIMTADNAAGGNMQGEIHMLGVDPGFRKRGIGRNVLLAGLAHLRNKGITTVRLTADGEYPAALGLYKSAGFKVSARSEWYEKKLGWGADKTAACVIK